MNSNRLKIILYIHVIFIAACSPSVKYLVLDDNKTSKEYEWKENSGEIEVSFEAVGHFRGYISMGMDLTFQNRTDKELLIDLEDIKISSDFFIHDIKVIYTDSGTYKNYDIIRNKSEQFYNILSDSRGKVNLEIQSDIKDYLVKGLSDAESSERMVNLFYKDTLLLDTGKMLLDSHTVNKKIKLVPRKRGL